METSTQLTKKQRDFQIEIQLKLSSIASFMGVVMKNLESLSEDVEVEALNLDKDSLPPLQHSLICKNELEEKEVTELLEGLTEDCSKLGQSIQALILYSKRQVLL